MYYCDYHIHSENSFDGKDSVMKLCERAKKIGLQEIAITDHLEPTQLDPTFKQYNPKKCLADIEEAREFYKGSLEIKHGIELGQPHMYPEHASWLLQTFPYDYVLASVHNLPKDINIKYLDFTGPDIEWYYKEYMTQLKVLARWNQFDCLSHLDLPKRYAAVNGGEFSLMRYRAELEEVLKILIHNGKGIEINTSGLKQSFQECFPSLDVLKLFRDLGGEIITVGSDTHRIKGVGQGIETGIEYAKQAGFDAITVYNQRKPEKKKI